MIISKLGYLFANRLSAASSISAKQVLGLFFALTLMPNIAAAAPPIFSKSFSPNQIGPGSVSQLTFTINNSAQSIGVTNLAFVDMLPAGVTIANPANAQTTCGGGTDFTAADGAGSVSVSGYTVQPNRSCTFSVDVASSTPGTHMNLSGDLTSSEGNSGPASADLTVVTTLPGFSKSFAPSSVPLGSRSTLTFLIDNSLNASGMNTLDFTDNLPNGMVIANPADASTTCGTTTIPATLTASAGGTSVELDSNGIATFPAVAAGATCTVTVDVRATSIGSLENVTESLMVTNPFFTPAGKASASLEVTRTELALSKLFEDDPTAPGSAVTLAFTVSNFSRDFSATGVGFTDDLAAALSGLTYSSLLSNDCGGSVSGVGSTSITVSGATVAPQGSCTI